MGESVQIRLLGDLAEGRSVVCDESDLPLVQGWDWFLSRDGYPIGRNSVGEKMMMHRLLCSAPKGHVVDHINGDRLDNRRSNLRVVSYSENGLNPRKRRKESSGPFRNVYKRGERFIGRFTHHGEEVYCGVHDNEFCAVEAVNKERRARGLDIIEWI